jgi:hypothetical protein
MPSTPAVFAISKRWRSLGKPGASRVRPSRDVVFFCVAWAGSGTVLRAALMPEMYTGPSNIS